MRDTLRDVMMVVATIGALFAGVQSWITDNKLEAVREELTGDLEAVREELTGDLEAVREELTRDLEAVREELAGDLDAVREELAEARGELRVTTDAVIAHVNEPGLHGRNPPD